MNFKNPRPLKYFLKNVFFIFSALVASFVFFEIGIRYFYPQTIIPGINTVRFGIPIGLKPNYNHKFTDPFGINYRVVTNEKGLRRAISTDYKKPAGVYRIMIIGDSIAYGYNVGNNQTFSFYLEKLLNQTNTGFKFEVLNSSVPGWGPFEYYFYLKNEGYKYDPDLIVLTFEDMDLIRLDTKQISIKNSKLKKTVNGNHLYLENPEIIPFNITTFDLVTSKIVQTQLYNLLSSKSHFFNLLRRRLTQILGPLSLNKPRNKKINEFLPKDKNPDQWIIKENGTERKVSGSVGFKWVGFKILIDKITSMPKNKDLNF
jgi:hypothetical protein